MLNRTQKSQIIEELTDKFNRQKIAIFTDFHGTSVAKAQSLRRLLKKDNAEYKVAKKTLLVQALEKNGIEVREDMLNGEIGITFGYEDQVAPARDLIQFRKENENFKILGGILEGRVLSDKDIIALARLPSREVLLAQVARAMQGPIRSFATVLQANIRNLAVILNKVKEQK